MWHDFHEMSLCPSREHVAGPCTVGMNLVLLDQRAHELLVLGCQRFEIHHGFAHPSRKGPLVVEDVGHSATHPCSKVTPGWSQDDDGSTGHVLAPVVSHAFHDRDRTAIAN